MNELFLELGLLSRKACRSWNLQAYSSNRGCGGLIWRSGLAYRVGLLDHFRSRLALVQFRRGDHDAGPPAI